MRKRVSDISLARSLVAASLREMQFLETVEPKIEAAATLIRGIYENFRRLGEALLAFQGFEGDHEDAIAALTQLDAKTKRPIQVLDSLRRLWHDINYRGYQPSQADLDDIISIKETCWKPILDKVSEIIK